MSDSDGDDYNDDAFENQSNNSDQDLNFNEVNTSTAQGDKE